MDPFDVIAATHEGQSDHVDVLGERPAQISLVLLTHGRDGDSDPRQVDSLVVRHLTGDDDFTEHIGRGDLQGTHPHLAIVDQDLVPGLDVPRKSLECGGAALLDTEDVFSGDGETIPAFEVVFLVIGELAETDLGALEISQDTQGAAGDP